MTSIRFRRSAIALLFCVGAASAHAAQPGYYAGIHGGANDVGDWDASILLGPVVNVPGTAAADRGRHWGAFGGRQTENARLELEYQVGDFAINGIRAGALSQAVATEGDYKALTVNVYRTFALGPAFNLYAGLGFGWAEVSLPQMGFTAGCNCFAAVKKDSTAYQGRLGAEWQFAPGHNAFVQYTSLRLPRPSSSATPGILYSRKSVGAVTVGYRHGF